MLTENIHIFRRLHLLADLALTAFAFEIASRLPTYRYLQEGHPGYWEL